jgi:hypothetical protein
MAALTVLKKVCDHPALLSERATKLVLTNELECLCVWGCLVCPGICRLAREANKCRPVCVV